MLCSGVRLGSPQGLALESFCVPICASTYWQHSDILPAKHAVQRLPSAPAAGRLGARGGLQAHRGPRAPADQRALLLRRLHLPGHLPAPLQVKNEVFVLRARVRWGGQQPAPLQVNMLFEGRVPWCGEWASTASGEGTCCLGRRLATAVSGALGRLLLGGCAGAIAGTAHIAAFARRFNFQPPPLSVSRDGAEDIRASVIEGIGRWIRAHPADYLSDQYLKYIAWALSDKVRALRLLCSASTSHACMHCVALRSSHGKALTANRQCLAVAW